MATFSGEREFQFHSTRLAAKEWGREGDFPVLALHGWLDNCGTFDVLAPLLHNVHIIAIDAAGHGLSQHRRDHGPYNLWQDVTDLYHVAEQLGWQRFALMGHSRGAMISTVFAGTFPDRVSHLALIDSMSPMPVEPEQTPEQLRKSIVDTQRRQNSKSTVYPDVESARLARQNSRVPISEQAVKHLLVRGLKKTDSGYTWTTDPKLMLPSAVKLSRQQIVHFIQSITAKIQLILAQDGLPEVYEGHKKLQQQYPHIAVTEMTGGHHLHLGEPAQQIAGIFNQHFKR